MAHTKSYRDAAYLADDGNTYVEMTLDLVFTNLERYLNGKPLNNIVDPALGY